MRAYEVLIERYGKRDHQMQWMNDGSYTVFVDGAAEVAVAKGNALLRKESKGQMVRVRGVTLIAEES